MLYFGLTSKGWEENLNFTYYKASNEADAVNVTFSWGPIPIWKDCRDRLWGARAPRSGGVAVTREPCRLSRLKLRYWRLATERSDLQRGTSTKKRFPATPARLPAGSPRWSCMQDGWGIPLSRARPPPRIADNCAAEQKGMTKRSRAASRWTQVEHSRSPFPRAIFFFIAFLHLSIL